MDKFGVETTRITRVCPRCGELAIREGSVLLCPSHGSAPFELPKKDLHGHPEDTEEEGS